MRLSPLMSSSRIARLTAASVLGATLLTFATGADADGERSSPNVDAALRSAEHVAHRALAWYRVTPAGERITWGGLAACALLGTWVLIERTIRVRRERVIPAEFHARFLDRLTEGKLDRGKGLDYCELNQSPVARVAVAVVRRWGRPVADLERAVAMARQLEADRLRRNVGTLRRIAALGPLVGLLGSLLATGRVLSALGATAVADSWGPVLAGALAPLTAGVTVAILALVAYDGLVGRIEALVNALDRAGVETVDAIIMASAEPRRGALAGPHRTNRAEIAEAVSQDD